MVGRGAVVYTSQAWGLEALRAYALWLDNRDRLPTYEPPPDNNFYNHPVWKLGGERPCSRPHLVEHSCYSGYHLPCDFARLVQVEPYQIYDWSFSRSVGSSVRLLEELRTIGPHLESIDENQASSDNPLWQVKSAFLQLREAAELSCKHRLPIIYHG